MVGLSQYAEVYSVQDSVARFFKDLIVNILLEQIFQAQIIDKLSRSPYRATAPDLKHCMFWHCQCRCHHFWCFLYDAKVTQR